ncbi:hypothetical protein CEUSTIGMA_g6388.t1 [Chlamydomonas eustigma]|uniref:Uncharacterized protein n=1 Tax=Chlamydomonas eustigma TaxID=1157962 RepID=A0A250X790_9CHLO|nr:hypothetical protein CEUSTIGMA_g6388.t1 [Chlamydomonas eustigma]|eukprot:GAX78948.1 hypothetical protein CEUSTIGMA_g6388.t1 [Chlamydomonas eustigma]
MMCGLEIKDFLSREEAKAAAAVATLFAAELNEIDHRNFEQHDKEVAGKKLLDEECLSLPALSLQLTKLTDQEVTNNKQDQAEVIKGRPAENMISVAALQKTTAELLTENNTQVDPKVWESSKKQSNVADIVLVGSSRVVLQRAHDLMSRLYIRPMTGITVSTIKSHGMESAASVIGGIEPSAVGNESTQHFLQQKPGGTASEGGRGRINNVHLLPINAAAAGEGEKVLHVAAAKDVVKVQQLGSSRIGEVAVPRGEEDTHVSGHVQMGAESTYALLGDVQKGGVISKALKWTSSILARSKQTGQKTKQKVGDRPDAAPLLLGKKVNEKPNKVVGVDQPKPARAAAYFQTQADTSAIMSTTLNAEEQHYPEPLLPKPPRVAFSHPATSTTLLHTNHHHRHQITSNIVGDFNTNLSTSEADRYVPSYKDLDSTSSRSKQTKPHKQSPTTVHVLPASRKLQGSTTSPHNHQDQQYLRSHQPHPPNVPAALLCNPTGDHTCLPPHPPPLVPNIPHPPTGRRRVSSSESDPSAHHFPMIGHKSRSRRRSVDSFQSCSLNTNPATKRLPDPHIAYKYEHHMPTPATIMPTTTVGSSASIPSPPRPPTKLGHNQPSSLITAQLLSNKAEQPLVPSSSGTIINGPRCNQTTSGYPPVASGSTDSGSTAAIKSVQSHVPLLAASGEASRLDVTSVGSSVGTEAVQRRPEAAGCSVENYFPVPVPVHEHNIREEFLRVANDACTPAEPETHTHQQYTLFSKSWLGRPGAVSPITALPSPAVSFHTPFGGVKQMKHDWTPDKKCPSRHCSPSPVVPHNAAAEQVVTLVTPQADKDQEMTSHIPGSVSMGDFKQKVEEGQLVSAGEHTVPPAVHTCYLWEAGSELKRDHAGQHSVSSHHIITTPQSQCLPPVV